jgi:hypothetical protein
MHWMGGINHNLQHEKPSESPNTPTFDCETKHISGWGWILMTYSYCSRCWITLYIYKADLLWAWTGWGASIITYIIIQVRNQENRLQILPVTVRPRTWRSPQKRHINFCWFLHNTHSDSCFGGAEVVGSSVAGKWSPWWQWQQHHKRPCIMAPLLPTDLNA